MSNWLNDFQYGLRRLLKQPGFALVAIATLALGIGANTAIFTLINEVLLKPLPFHEAENLVMVYEDSSAIGFPRDTPAPANYVDWKNQNRVFSDVAALDFRSFNITGDGEPEKVNAYGVTANFFPLLGVQPSLGRGFLAEEDKPGAEKALILSYGLWQRRYGGDPNIINKQILMDGEKYNVVGVMPAGFQFQDSFVGLWVPAALSPQDLASRGNHYLNVVARLKPGVTLEQAQADIAGITSQIARDYPDDAQGLKSEVVSLREVLTGESKKSLIMLLIAVGFVLLIACANIANLLLSRSASRRKEIAVRTALGANRWRIVRQLLIESALLAGIGGVLGVLLALWSFEFLQKLIPSGLMLTAFLEIDLRVLGFALFISVLTILLFGLVPALQATRIDLNETLKLGGGRGGLSAGGNRLRSILVVAEIAMALVLLVGAGLLIQTVYNLRSQYSFFQPEKLMTLRTVLPDGKYKEHPRRVVFYDQVLERVSALPGVVEAGYTTSVPLQWKGGANGFSLEDPRPESFNANANHRQVSANYLQTMGIPLRQGRYLNDGDNQQSIPVMVVNETLARYCWPGENPIGKRVKFGDRESASPWVTVVGVVADVRQMGMDQPVKAEMYKPYRQLTTQAILPPRDLVIRTTTDPMSLVAAVRQAVHSVDADQPLSNIATMSELLVEESARRSTGMILLVAFAGLALLLSSLGIYGVLAYFVTQRTSEIGVRLALGAQRRDVLSLILKKGMAMTFTGVGIGALTAFALTRLMKSLLYQVSVHDPFTFSGIALLLLVVAFLACLIPALRATKVDPMIALRCE